MQTYNFEQAMEGVFHGIKVRRLVWARSLSLVAGDGGAFWRITKLHLQPYPLIQDDFYAQDWVAYEDD